MENLKPNSVVWCPFDKEESQFVKVLKEEGHTVLFTHIENGQDFFQIETPDCDYIISNPPYSLKTEVFKKLYKTKKPFAMLINFSGIFDSVERFDLFSNNKTELLYLSPRVQYTTTENLKNSVPFQSGYLCSGILKNQIEFKKIFRD